MCVGSQLLLLFVECEQSRAEQQLRVGVDAPVGSTTALAILEVLVGEANTRSRHRVAAMPKSMVAGWKGTDVQTRSCGKREASERGSSWGGALKRAGQLERDSSTGSAAHAELSSVGNLGKSACVRKGRLLGFAAQRVAWRGGRTVGRLHDYANNVTGRPSPIGTARPQSCCSLASQSSAAWTAGFLLRSSRREPTLRSTTPSSTISAAASAHPKLRQKPTHPDVTHRLERLGTSAIDLHGAQTAHRGVSRCHSLSTPNHRAPSPC